MTESFGRTYIDDEGLTRPRKLTARELWAVVRCREGAPPPRSSGAVTVETYREDPLYPKIVRAVELLLRAGKVVAPVDVLVKMGLLDRRHLEDWRRGGVPYLERVITSNLTRLSRLLRILRFHAHELNLDPSWTAHMRLAKGPKQRLRFTKTWHSRQAPALRVAA